MTAVRSLRLEKAGYFGILDDISDLATDKGYGRLVRVDIRSEVVERLKEESEPAPFVPDAFIDFLVLGLQNFEGRFLALGESHCEKRVDLAAVLVDLLLLFAAH